MFQDHIRLAFITSFALHLLCVTAVEAAVSLGKIFDHSSRTPLITFWDMTQREPDSPSAPKLPLKESMKEVQVSVSQGRQAIPQPATVVSDGLHGLSTEESNDQPEHVALLSQALKRFNHFQREMDGRIKKVKKELVALVPQKESSSTELVWSQIADLQKVPLQARKETIPTYLQMMRARIARQWSQSIQSLEEEAGVATVQFRIHPEGTISALTFISGSGGENFKHSCLSAVIGANPFEPLPFTFDDIIGERYLTVMLTFHLRKASAGDRGSI